MKTIKNILSFCFGLLSIYLIISLIWGILNTQSCSYKDLPENPTCEQSAENSTNNCKYIILRWKKVDYNKELQACKEWEQNQERVKDTDYEDFADF